LESWWEPGLKVVERINPLKTGFVIPSKDVMSLRKTMITLSEDDSLCSEFGKNARKRYEEKFTNEIAGRKYMQIYNDILGA
jgi:rhamnosyl/mannosyltransferase